MARRIALAAREAGREVLEKAYPGYRLAEAVQVRSSPYTGGVYITALMAKEGRAAPFANSLIQNALIHRKGGKPSAQPG